MYNGMEMESINGWRPMDYLRGSHEASNVITYLDAASVIRGRSLR